MMQLYVWSPALGAPSIDPKCVVIESYLRVLELKYSVVYANDPQTSPTGKTSFTQLIRSTINRLDALTS
jgi:sorting and assembly machinery component 37/metaxin